MHALLLEFSYAGCDKECVSGGGVRTEGAGDDDNTGRIINNNDIHSNTREGAKLNEVGFMEH
jgi:hypothetical protein